MAVVETATSLDINNVHHEPSAFLSPIPLQLSSLIAIPAAVYFIYNNIIIIMMYSILKQEFLPHAELHHEINYYKFFSIGTDFIIHFFSPYCSQV